ncbi:enoyl-CoA hydratase/isomerase family protein [Dongia soli]|uniref:Enoyl-CoA hydratase-related protein n=1 Tax=Dongia soli TaxID=600628 RepID=A0ABU5EFP7_9PROT|nr:enoyl-CoA hydratase-related protein [Dongia soli]MDY0885041.1 enoyl-CoA hydratase-related protein [Dongia soli]
MLHIESQGALRVLTFDRPEARNALSSDLLKEMRAAIHTAKADRSCRALMITGRGKAFCAGADVQEWALAEAAGQLETYGWTEAAHSLCAEIYDFDRPTIALMNGAAVGAGLDLACACDFRIASDAAKFCCAYTKMGYAPDCGGTWLLPKLIGREAAKLFVFTGDFWNADEALRRGLITAIYPADQLLEKGLAFGQKLANGPTVALSAAKRLINESGTRNLHAQLAAERVAGEICGRSTDAKEALSAAVAKREPVFQGH